MIFDLNNNQPTITIEGIHIPEFRAIWEADTSEEKLLASQVLSYVYHMSDFGSSYAKLSEEDRQKECEQDYIKEDLDDIWWGRIQDAIDKYKKLQETPSMRLVEGAKHAVAKLTEYFYNIDFTAIDDRGRPLYNAKDVSINLEKVGKIVDSINDLEERVNKEKASSSKITRGAKPSNIL